MQHQQAQGDYNLIQSYVCGHVHPDTLAFDDVQQLVLDPHSSRIHEIEVEYDTLVYGIIVTYQRGPGTEAKVQHLGNGHGHRHKAAIHFSQDEFITHISGRHGDVYDHLKIVTNKGQTLDVGGHGGNPFDFQIPQNYTVLGFKGGLGGHIHNLSLILKPIFVWNPQPSIRAGVTNPDTRPWDDLPLLAGAYSSQITEIKAVTDGHIVVGLDIHYLVNGTEHRSAGWHLGTARENLQSEQILQLAWDEHIVRVHGRSGNAIDFLRIETNKRRELAIGGRGGSVDFELVIPPGKRVVAFGGGCNGHLHNLYLHLN